MSKDIQGFHIMFKLMLKSPTYNGTKKNLAECPFFRLKAKNNRVKSNPVTIKISFVAPVSSLIVISYAGSGNVGMGIYG